jgi:hypothetical protein
MSATEMAAISRLADDFIDFLVNTITRIMLIIIPRKQMVRVLYL